MKYKNITFFSALMAAFLAFIPGNLAGEINTVDEVLKAAHKGLPEFLESIPADELTHYGFQSTEEFSQAELGTPFKVYTVLPEKLEVFQQQDLLNDILIETGNWYVPILVGGKQRVLLTISSLRGRFETVGLSGAGLASELDEFQSSLSEKLKTAGITGSYSIKFVRIFQAYSDFMLIQTEMGEYVYPFTSAQMALDFKQEGLQPLAVIMTGLKARVKENLKK